MIRTLAFVALLVAAGAVAADELVIEAGTPIAEALELLRARGLRIVYSTALVPRDLKVAESVQGGDPSKVARVILAPHGLDLRSLGSNTLAVVEGRSALRWVLRGRVVSSHGEQPVPRARLEIAEQGRVAWSDRNGLFALRMVGREERTLSVLADGYAAQTQRVSYLAPKPHALEISLTPTSLDLEEVTIVSSRYTYGDLTTTGAFSLDQADIVAQPKIAEDALQALTRLPGVATSGLSARPNVRGGEASEVLVALDGMPIREAFHLPEYNSAFSAIDEALVARLDAYTGTLPARFGNRLSAVVEVESTAADRPSESAIGLSTFNARLRSGRRHEGEGVTEWLASGRLGTARLWLEDYSPDVGRPAYGDVFVKARRVDDEGNELRAAALWSGSDFEYFDPETTENAALGSDAAYAWVAARRTLSDRMELEGLLAFSDIRSDRQGILAGGLTPEGELREKRSSQIWDAQLLGTLEVSARHAVMAGVSASLGRARYRHASEVEFDPLASDLFGVPEERIRESALELSRSFLSAFVGDRWQVAPGFFFETGLRLEHDLEGVSERRTYVSPRIAARWDVGAATRLRASWGRAHQSAEVHELRIEDGETLFGPAQRADQWVVSAERLLGLGAAFRLEGFWRRMPNPRIRYENFLDPLRFIPDLSPDRIALSPASSRSRGAEASLQFEQGEWSMWGAYTFSKAEDRIEGRWIPRDWDQRHTVAASVSWRRGPWSASLFGSYHSGRPTTPLLDTRLASPALGERNSARLSGYATVDARVAREFPLARGKLVAFAQVTNLFNRANRCCTEIDLPDEDSDELSLEHEAVQTYPILPAVGLQWEY